MFLNTKKTACATPTPGKTQVRVTCAGESLGQKNDWTENKQVQWQSKREKSTKNTNFPIINPPRP